MGCLNCGSREHLIDRCPKVFTDDILRRSAANELSKATQDGFVECPVCRKMSGTPTLCYSCLTNRTLIEQQAEPEAYGCNKMLKEVIADMRFVNKCYKEFIEAHLKAKS